ncbi:probable LRR receptor-like serine/threonine-protein kinase At1g53420 isoform X2 [Andrographis paniculata]|uniref:probable LRR receptor-like serine/threonine-protein kinase At1g53420 isoform X2 n=1 Tax=Andrographis paniculata TaxID=175694 RepID=UPI0021E7AFAB|nr:probable LRR receptor-like serine/threonine-protein kinase At1g53420 isoform X2 [Andrographis paniculata]
MMLFQWLFVVFVCLWGHAFGRAVPPTYHHQGTFKSLTSLGKSDWDRSVDLSRSIAISPSVALEIDHAILSARTGWISSPSSSLDPNDNRKGEMVKPLRKLSLEEMSSSISKDRFIISSSLRSSSREMLASIGDPIDPRKYPGGRASGLAAAPWPYSPAHAPIPSTRKESSTSTSHSTGIILGVVTSIVIVIFLLGALLWWKGYRPCKYATRHGKTDDEGPSLHTTLFTLKQIKAATNNFNPKNKVGEGGFGPVYKDGTVIAVKQLSTKSKQGNREFVNEVGMISVLKHPHLVKLYGCCIEANQLLLVYEYMENNSLARALFGSEGQQLHLDWPTRRNICLGIARGLYFLHEESRIKIVHRDIKATNVLLDKDLTPKISDFGIARLDEEDCTHISTRIAGTYGYMSPEYAMRGYLTDKADVYAFGIVLLEIVSGKSIATTRGPNGDPFFLLEWAKSLKKMGKLLELVDPRLESNYKENEVKIIIELAFVCTNVESTERPNMSTVVNILEKKTYV